MPNPKSNLSDVAILTKVNEGGIESLTPDELEYFAGMEEAKEVKKSLADAAVLKVKAEATGGKINASNFNGGYASRVEGKDASGEWLTSAQRKENFKKEKAVSFVNGKSDEKKGVGVGKNGSLALREPSKVAPEDIKGEEGKNEEIDKLKSILVPAFSKIEGHLQSILGTFRDQQKLGKKQDRKEDIIAEKGAKKGREGELEGKKPRGLQLAEKAVKPVKGIFEMIWDFVKNVLLGAALLGLLKIFENFDKIKKQVIGVVNNIIGFLNFLLEIIFGPILSPINALISGLNMGFSAIFDAINAVLAVFKQDPLDPWEIQPVQPPQIPTIPLPPEPKTSVQRAEGGGEVTNVTNVTNEGSDTSVQEDKEDGGNDVKDAISDSTGGIDETISQSEASLGDQISQTENLMNQIPDGEDASLPSEAETTPKDLTNILPSQEAETTPKDLTNILPSDNLNKGGNNLQIPKNKGGNNLQIPKDKGVVKGVQSAMGGGAIQRMQGGGKTKHVNASDISAAPSGSVTSQSGVKIGGMGPDTQLVAAQPGEIVMSKPAVQYHGANKLLAMNKEGGGTNKPKRGMVEGVQVSGMQGGGLVGGTPGTPRNPKNRKIFLHWSAGGHASNAGPYHQLFKASGAPRSTSVNYGADAGGHTGGHNTDSVGLGIAAMRKQKGAGHQGYVDWPTGSQLNAIVGESAALASAWGWSSGDVDKNVMTHGEWERHAVKTGRLSSPPERWDLDMLKDGPVTHPGGHFTTQKVHSKGGNTLRSAIKAKMAGMDPGLSGPDQLPETGPAVASVGNNTGTPSTSSPPGPPGSKTANVKVLPLPGPTGLAQAGSAAAADQARVSGFSAIDVNNLDLLPVRSIYNIVG